MDELEPNASFPYTRVRVPGIIQIGLGIISVLVGATSIALYYVWGTFKTDGTSLPTFIPAVVLIGAPLYCGVLFVIAGALGTSTTKERHDNRVCLRNCFLTFSLLAAIVFAPVQIAACGLYVLAFLPALLQMKSMHMIVIWVLSALGTFFGFVEFLVAIVSACICCCCAKSESREEAYTMVPSA